MIVQLTRSGIVCLICSCWLDLLNLFLLTGLFYNSLSAADDVYISLCMRYCKLVLNDQSGWFERKWQWPVLQCFALFCATSVNLTLEPIWTSLSLVPIKRSACLSVVLYSFPHCYTYLYQVRGEVWDTSKSSPSLQNSIYSYSSRHNSSSHSDVFLLLIELRKKILSYFTCMSVTVSYTFNFYFFKNERSLHWNWFGY